MVVARRGSGLSHPVVRYFDTLAGLKRGRDATARVAAQGGRDIAVLGEHGVSGVDNGFNLLETSFAPVGPGWRPGPAGPPGMAGTADARAALAAEDAVLLNASEHPAARWIQSGIAGCARPAPSTTSWWTIAAGCTAWASTPRRRTALHLRAGGAGLPRPERGPGPGTGGHRAVRQQPAGRPRNRPEGKPPDHVGPHVPPRALRRRSLPAAAAAPAVRGPGRPFPLDVRPRHDQPRAAGRALAGLQRAAPLYLRDAPCPAFSRRRAGPPATARPAGNHRWFPRPRISSIRSSPISWTRAGATSTRRSTCASCARCGTKSCSSAWARRAIEGRAPGAVFPDRQLADEAGADVARSAAGALCSWPAAQPGPGRSADARLGLAPIARLAPDCHPRCAGRRCRPCPGAGRGPGRPRRTGTRDRPWLAYASHCVATRSTGADRMLRLWRSGGDSAARLGSAGALARPGHPLDQAAGSAGPQDRPALSASRDLVRRQQHVHRGLEADETGRFRFSAILAGSTHTWVSWRGLAPLKMRAMVSA